jgi:hypothetical protein
MLSLQDKYIYIGGVMVGVLVSNAVDRGFTPWLGQIKLVYVASPLLST